MPKIENPALQLTREPSQCAKEDERLKVAINANHKRTRESYRGWGSATWKVACRDNFIGWDAETRQANLHKVVNNVRFLILPWVRVKHLASKVLSIILRALPSDWWSFYSQDIALAETFVDTERFAGTCYQAANWNRIGETKGRGKYDRYGRAEANVKAVYLYPLARDFRERLHG